MAVSCCDIKSIAQMWLIVHWFIMQYYFQMWLMMIKILPCIVYVVTVLRNMLICCGEQQVNITCTVLIPWLRLTELLMYYFDNNIFLSSFIFWQTFSDFTRRFSDRISKTRNECFSMMIYLFVLILLISNKPLGISLLKFWPILYLPIYLFEN